MPIDLGAIASGAPSALQFGIDQYSAKQARDFSEREAGKSRAWQENMFKTRYQNTVEDMRAAGINPILAYQQGGGSVPSGATAQTTKADSGKVVASGLEAYQKGLETKRLADTLKNTKKQRELMSAQTDQAHDAAKLSQATALQAISKTRLTDYEASKLRIQSRIWDAIHEQTSSSAKSMPRRPIVIKQKHPKGMNRKRYRSFNPSSFRNRYRLEN